MQTIRTIEKPHRALDRRVGKRTGEQVKRSDRQRSSSADPVFLPTDTQTLEQVDHFNLRSFDLNLLLVFDALMKERSVTRAAARLKIQQPAMSHNLSTLRLLLQDELFVRVGQAMRPTPRARALAAGVSQVLLQAHRLLLTSQPFDPSREQRIFRIGFTSELEVILMPELSKLLQEKAPGIRVLARSADPENVFRMLDDHLIDLAIGCYQEGSARHKHKALFQQSLMCCYNKSLVQFKGKPDRTSYLAAKHALISQKQEIEGCLDSALKKLGVRLNVAMAAPEFLTVLTAVARAPFVATLPARIVKRYAAMFGLTACDVPLELEVTPFAMLWPVHADKDPASEWIRKQVEPLISQLQPMGLA